MLPKVLAFCAIACLLATLSTVGASGLDDPDYDRDTCQLILSRGFGCELHFPKTKDGYVSQLFRIVNPFVARTRGPVLLMHGLLGSSVDFVIADAGGHARPVPVARPHFKSANLGFELANHGYDVFLGNFRGLFFMICFVTSA